MARVRISKKGQILIPKKIRDKYSFNPGDMALVIESDKGILLKSVTENPIEAACGFLNGSVSLTYELLEDHLPRHRLRRRVSDAVDRLLSLPEEPVPKNYRKWEKEHQKGRYSCP